MFWNNPAPAGPIGLIAGQGEFPILFAKAASALKKEVIVFGVEGYVDRRVESYARETHYVKLGALAELMDLLKRSNVKKVVLAGGIPKREIYNPAAGLDGTAKDFIQKTANKGDDHILKAFGLFLKARCGVSIIDSRFILKDILAPKGVMTRRAPMGNEEKDLRFGWRIAKGIGKMDIGQTVVVKNGVVLAVEALEGTDAAIRRGGDLGNGEAVIVKVSKPNQDLRFDLPCVGFETLDSMKAAGCRVLGVEAGKTIIFSKDQLIEKADRESLVLVGL